jgi:hypothetical protein
MQTALTILIVVAAAAYVLWTFYKSFIRKQNGACSCTDCHIADSCSESQNDDTGKRAS